MTADPRTAEVLAGFQLGPALANDGRGRVLRRAERILSCRMADLREEVR